MASYREAAQSNARGLSAPPTEPCGAATGWGVLSEKARKQPSTPVKEREIVTSDSLLSMAHTDETVKSDDEIYRHHYKGQ